ncbi:hypothetical protein BSKO_09926 [Bryopsis sp. KO-2023]|nr:hypothetical protein BSKO_09926 [Bryopsis sp. KO-2023]
MDTGESSGARDEGFSSLLFEGDHSTWDPGDFSWDSSSLTAAPVGIQESEGGVFSNGTGSSGTLGKGPMGMQAPCGHRLTGPCDPLRGAGSCCALRSVCPFAEGSSGGTPTVASPQATGEPTPVEMDMALATLFEGLNDVGNGVGSTDKLQSPRKVQNQTCGAEERCSAGQLVGDSCFGRSACEIEGIAEVAAKRHRISFPWEEGKREVEMVGGSGPSVGMPAPGMVQQQDAAMFLNMPTDMPIGPMTGFGSAGGLQNPPMSGFGLNQSPVPNFAEIGMPTGGSMQYQISSQRKALGKESAHDEEKAGFWGLGQNDPVPDGTPILSSDTSGLKMICQVAGCGKSLEDLKDYHQRYRICDVHIKLPQVIKHGRLERFCQQCGRFHDLAAFDGNRRSCRDQLSKHNARRRKRALSKNHPPVEEQEAGHDDTDAGKLLQALLKSPTQLRALRMLLGLTTNAALPGMNTSACPNCNGEAQEGRAAKEHSPLPSAEGSGTSVAGRNREQGTFDTSRKIMNGEGEFAEGSVNKDESTLRLSMKIFSVTPDQLPQNLKSDLVEWLGKAPKSIDGSIRPGCVFLTISLVVDTDTARRAFDSGIEGLVAQLVTGADRQVWLSNVMVVQLGLAVGLFFKGRLRRLYQNSMSCPVCPLPLQPRLEDVSPRCVSASNPGTLTFVGKHLACTTCELVCRSRGKHLKPPAPLQPVSDSTVRCTVPATSSTSLYTMEICCGSLLSESRCVFLTDNATLRREINSLPGSTFTDQDLSDVGMIAHFLQNPGEGKVSPCRISCRARKLLCLACDHGCVALAELMMAGAVASRKGKQSVLAAEDASSSAGGGLKLMHRAVRSGNVELVRKLKSWGKENGHIFDGTDNGPMGLTPLHLSALLEDDGHMTVELLRSISSDVYTTLKTKEGLTPFHLGLQMGHFPVDRVVELLKNSGLLYGKKKPKLMKASEESKACCPNALSQFCCSLTEEEKLACTRCNSNLPLLLLSIMSKCGMCGASNAGPFSSTGSKPTNTIARDPFTPSLSGMLECQHQEAILYSITAMCQACHTNSVVVV